MIVVAIFLSLAILPTARAADETVWASDDPVENYCVAVDAVVKVYSADAVNQIDPVLGSAAVLQPFQKVAGIHADPLRETILNALVREDPDLLSTGLKSVAGILTGTLQLLSRGKLDRNFRVPAEVVVQIGIGIAFGFRAAVGADCGSPTIRVEPR